MLCEAMACRLKCCCGQLDAQQKADIDEEMCTFNAYRTAENYS